MILMNFSDFSNFWKQMKKKYLIIMKKKKFVQKIVLQPEEKRKNRIARLVLYCNRGRL